MNVIFEVHSGKRSKYTTPLITGDRKLPDKQIIKSTHWHHFLWPGWRPISDTRTRDGIDGVQKKYQSKNRLQAKVELKKLDNDPKKHVATPTIDVNAGPTVKVTTLEARPKRKLKEYIPVYDEGAVDNDLLVEGARIFRTYFQNQGYYEVQIDFRETAVPGKDETDVEYVISGGRASQTSRGGFEGEQIFQDGGDQGAADPARGLVPAVPPRPIQRRVPHAGRGDHHESL